MGRSSLRTTSINLIISALVLFVVGTVPLVTHVNSTSLPSRQTLSYQTIDNNVAFALPQTLTPTSDAGPGYTIVGGALLRHDLRSYDLVLGVEVDKNNAKTVADVAMQLIASLGKGNLQSDQMTSQGRRIDFLLGNDDAYSVILAKFNYGLREILINNEHNNPLYLPLIQQFVNSVHNLSID